MDGLSHVLWMLVLFKDSPDLGLALFFGIFPDLVFVWVAVLYTLYRLAGRKKTRAELFPLAREAYRWSHSFLVWGIAFVAASVYAGKPFLPMFAWLFHNIADLWTHKGSPVGNMRPFYPLSKFEVKGLVWWREPRFWIPNWIALLAALYIAYAA